MIDLLMANLFGSTMESNVTAYVKKKMIREDWVPIIVGRRTKNLLGYGATHLDMVQKW